MPLFLGIHESVDETAVRLAVAVGIGLLLGIERERRKGSGPARAPAGLRTFALVALLGGIAAATESTPVIVVAGTFVALAALTGYALGDRTDPGITTEVALMMAFLLGAYAQQEPAIAAGAGMAATILLAARTWLHHFVQRVLTEEELQDGLLFGAAALVVLPLAPDRSMGPYDVFNPFVLWRLVVLVMAVSAAGYIAQRALGPRLGLPLAGFASGLFSSTATIAAMGSRTRRQPAVANPALAGAVLSNIASLSLLLMIVGTVSRAALEETLAPVAAAAVAITAYGTGIALLFMRSPVPRDIEVGRAFELKMPVAFAGTVAAALFISAAVNDVAGQAGLVVAVAITGIADSHSAAFSSASLVAAGRLEAGDALLPILAGLTTNSGTKAVLALVTGGRGYALTIGAGLVIMLIVAWVAFVVQTAA
ncbi:MAG: DUF4010 domain-containing protein [Dehalococcoidia bacterium]